MDWDELSDQRDVESELEKAIGEAEEKGYRRGLEAALKALGDTRAKFSSHSPGLIGLEMAERVIEVIQEDS